MGAPATDEQLIELQGQATLGRLLASVAHELSAPVASLVSNADVQTRLLSKLESALAEPSSGKAMDTVAACRELVRVDQLACDRIRRIITSLKTAARADDGAFLRVNVNDVLDASVVLAKTAFRGRVEVRVDFGALPLVECRPHLLSQVFLNLLTNAGQAIENTGVVTVNSRAEGNSVHVSVADTGRGIRDEDKPKVLSRRFTTKPLGVGTGLGLSIVQEIVVSVHGGNIEFESELGRGTIFHVRIPVDHAAVETKKEGA